MSDRFLWIVSGVLVVAAIAQAVAAAARIADLMGGAV